MIKARHDGKFDFLIAVGRLRPLAYQLGDLARFGAFDFFLVEFEAELVADPGASRL